MFTGLVTEIGRVVDVSGNGDRRIKIAASAAMTSAPIGASIACSGVCLTVVETVMEAVVETVMETTPAQNGPPGWFAVDVSGETLSKTTLGEWAVGARVNLERSLRVGDELGGHIVSGHVDGTGHVAARQTDGESVRFTIEAPAALAPFIAPKGSIAVDGVSLTVNEVDDPRLGVPGAPGVFGVNVIPHTQAATTLGDLAAGARVNLEIDVLARYVARLEEMRRGG